MPLAKDRTRLCFTVVHKLSYKGKRWSERKATGTVRRHVEIPSLTKKISQEVGEKHTHEGQKDRCKDLMSSPTTDSIQISRMFITGQITIATQRNTLEKIQQRKSQHRCYIYSTITTKCFVSCLFHCLLTWKLHFKNMNPGNMKTHTHGKSQINLQKSLKAFTSTLNFVIILEMDKTETQFQEGNSCPRDDPCLGS